MKATITVNIYGDPIARDENGIAIASRRRYCNPAALTQLILNVELMGYEIDWANSQVAEPKETQ